MTRRPGGLPGPPTGPAGPTPTGTNQPAPWLGLTPTGRQLEEMDRVFLHRAVDQLERETVAESYWRKVLASRQAKAWDVR